MAVNAGKARGGSAGRAVSTARRLGGWLSTLPRVYKLGQGYWTRLLSGLGGGVLLVSLAFWLYNEVLKVQLGVGLEMRAAIAVGLVIIGGLFLFYLVGAAPRSCDFLIATEGEMKKVNWPSRKEIIGSTWVVICGVIIITAILFASDVLFALLFKKLQILKGSMPWE